MKSLFLSPHDDDNVLYGAFTCLREKPLILVVLDSYIQPNRGEKGCSAEERARETEKANEILECKVERLGIHDDESLDRMENLIRDALTNFHDYDIIYAPAFQRGNVHHDLVNKIAAEMFGEKVSYYTTYTKTELWTKSRIEIVPLPREIELKNKALECYQSQLKINAVHFDAVLGKSEWLGDRYGEGINLYIGAGSHRLPGWTHLDIYPFPGIDIICDLTKGIPLEDCSVAKVYSQDCLEHLPQESKIFVMNEIWRVLLPGGTMEHIIPQAGSQNDFGSPSHLSHWTQQQFEHFDVNSYRFEKDRYYEGFKGGFIKILSDLASDGQTFHVMYSAVK